MPEKRASPRLNIRHVNPAVSGTYQKLVAKEDGPGSMLRRTCKVRETCYYVTRVTLYATHMTRLKNSG